MKTVTVKVYSFAELSEDSKEFVLENQRKNTELGSYWQDENLESLTMILKFFDWKITNVSLDYSSASASSIDIFFKTEYDGAGSMLSGVRLWKYINKNYVGSKELYGVFDGKENGHTIFTGYCADNIIVQPVYDFMKKPSNISFKELMEQSVKEYLKYMEEDYNNQRTDEFIIEDMSNNGPYEFYVTGQIFNEII